MNQTKVVIYTRVSSSKQVRSGNGLDSQKRMCEEYALKNNLFIVKHFYDGGISWKYTSREGLDAMIDFLSQANTKFTDIQYVLVDDIDRIIRDVKGWWDIKSKIELQWGAKIYSLKQNIDDTPEWKMLQSITMSVKQYERENNARRTRDRKKARMLDGYYNLPTVPWYEYIKNPFGSGRLLSPIERKCILIKKGLELFADGILGQKVDLLRYYQKNWLTSKKGNLVHKSYISRLLAKNRLLFYAGYINFEAREVYMVQWKHDKIIDLDTVNKIEKRLKRKQPWNMFSKSEVARKLPLRGILICEQCDCSMTGAASKWKMGVYYFYYSCRKKGCELYGKSINSIKIHTLLKDKLTSIAIDPELYLSFKWVLDDLNKNETDIQKNIAKENHRKLLKIEKEIKKFQERVLGTDDSEMIKFYEDNLKQLFQEKLTFEEKVNDENQLGMWTILQTRKEAKVILENPLFIWELNDLALKRLMINVLFNNHIFYSVREGSWTLSFPHSNGVYTNNLLSKFHKSGYADVFTNPKLLSYLEEIKKLIPLIDAYSSIEK